MKLNITRTERQRTVTQGFSMTETQKARLEAIIEYYQVGKSQAVQAMIDQSYQSLPKSHRTVTEEDAQDA